jgi:hypothetical protein
MQLENIDFPFVHKKAVYHLELVEFGLDTQLTVPMKKIVRLHVE